MIAEYDPAQVLRASVAGSDIEVTVREALLPNCTGDLVQLSVLARLLLQSAHLDLDATLEIAMLEVEGVPTIRMAIEGPGRFIDPLKIPLYVQVNGEEVESVWIRANTRWPHRLPGRSAGPPPEGCSGYPNNRMANGKAAGTDTRGRAEHQAVVRGSRGRRYPVVVWREEDN